MSRFSPILLAFFLAFIATCGLAASGLAQSVSNTSAVALAPLLQQNRLIADVARDDPDGLWNLVSKISLLTSNPRDGGPARAVATPTREEAAQIEANPALRLLYDKDPAATVALLRATNEELRRAHLREDQGQPRRIALVVGSSGDGVWGNLGTTRNDANLIANALIHQGFEISGGGALIDPDKPHLEQAIRQFAHAITPGTVALFYYAGHGVQAGARNFIVPARAAIPQTKGDYDKNLVALDDDVLRQMQQAGGRLNILVLDACRDHPPLPSHDPVSHEAQQPAKGLAPMGAPSATSGTLIIYSTGPNSIARDGANGAADSPFASAFAAAICLGGMDIRDVFDRVAASVDQATQHEQQPWISYSGGDKFYFAAIHRPEETGRNLLDASGSLCPKPGTTITFFQAGEPMTGTYRPTDAGHPELCHVALSNGKTRTLLYNLYDTEAVSDLTSASLALEELLSGRKDQVEFENRWMVRYPFQMFVESWTRLGQETLDIDNRQFATIVFEHDINGNGAPGSSISFNYFASPKRWKVWYDPAVGVIRQTELPVTGSQNEARRDGPQVFFVSPY